MSRFGVTEAVARAAFLEDSAMAMRANGFSYDEIAEKLNISRDKVGKAVNRALKRYRAQVSESCDHVVTLESFRLDEMFQKIHSRIRAGDLEAIAVGLKIMDRRSKLLGLDAPTKNVQVNTTPEQSLSHISLDELRKIDALLSAPAGPAGEFEEPEETDYLEGASLPEEREASGPTAIAPSKPRVSDANPLDDRL